MENHSHTNSSEDITSQHEKANEDSFITIISKRNLENSAKRTEDFDNNDKYSEVYEWINSLTLSGPINNFRRDFSDGRYLAEIIYFYIPKIIDLNNYFKTSSIKSKYINWNLLEERVLRKIKVKLTKEEKQNIIEAKKFAIEPLLKRIYNAIENYLGCPIVNGEEPILRKKKINREQQEELTSYNDLRAKLDFQIRNIEELEEEIAELEKQVDSLDQEGIILKQKVDKYKDLLKKKSKKNV
jgi:cell division protein FtsB